MLCLRCSFDTWVDNEPEEAEHPLSEAEEEALREKEQYHEELFSSMEHLAAKLSSTLGVGRLADKRLKQGIGSFFKEGIRWSFSTAGEMDEDEYWLGSRLPFLTIIGKYGTWLKKEKSTRQEIKDHFLDSVNTLRNHEKFNEVHPDDLKHLREFAKMLGIPDRQLLLPADDETTMQTDYTSREEATTPSPHSSSRRSRPSTTGSIRSRMSSTLSPVEESRAGSEDDFDEEDEGRSMESSPKRSIASSFSRSTRRSRGTIDENGEERRDSDGESV